MIQNLLIYDSTSPSKRSRKRRKRFLSDQEPPRKQLVIYENGELEGVFTVDDDVCSQLLPGENQKCPGAKDGYDSFDEADEHEAYCRRVPEVTRVVKRKPLLLEDGYDSLDDAEEDRRLNDLCASLLDSEVVQLRAKTEDLKTQLKLAVTREQETHSAFLKEHRERVKQNKKLQQLRDTVKAQQYTIGLQTEQLEEERCRRALEGYCVGGSTSLGSGILGICKCLFSAESRLTMDATILVYPPRPPGCQSYYLLNVRGKYDDGDAWCQAGAAAWTVAYHGTTLESLQQIVRNGFHMSKAQRSAFGHGLYCTPDPATARSYATRFMHKSSVYRAVLQCFVDPKEKQSVKPANDAERRDGEYWIVMSGYAIRPYAICIYDEFSASCPV